MKRSSLLILEGIAILLFTGFTIKAETDTVSKADSNSVSHFSLDAVTVTAPTRHDLDTQSLTNPYKVEKNSELGTQIITREDIEKLAPKDIFDLFNKAAGLNVTYQGRKSPFFVDVRGGGNLTYILDGAVLPTSSNRILQKIPMSAIEEIQIVRGSTSLALGPSIPIGSSNSGSGVNTGFVIIRTRQPVGTEASMSGFVEKSDGQPIAHGQSIFTGTHIANKSSTGFLGGLNGYIGGLLSGNDFPSTDTRFDGTNADAGMLTTGLNLKKFSLNGMLYRDCGRLEMQRGVTVLGVLDNSKWYYDPLITTVISSNMTMEWTKNQITLASIFYTKYDQTERDESFTDTTPVNKKHFVEKTNGCSIRHNARFFSNTPFSTLFQPGLQITNSTGFGPNTNQSYNDWTTSVLGWSASAEQSLFNVATLNAGYRWDRKHIDTSAISALKVSANNDQNLAPAQVVTAGGEWHIKDLLVLNACYYYGYEGTVGDFDIKTKAGTPLDPDKQQRVEVALKCNWKKYLQPTFTVFNVDVKNQKSATTDTYKVDGYTYYYYTQSDALRRGLELLLEGETTISGTKYSASWTHMTKNQTTSNGIVTNALGLSSPNNLFTVTLNQAVRNYLMVNVSLKRVDPWTSSTSAMGTAYNVNLGDYTTLDANIMKDIMLDNHKITAKLYGRNLTNEKYATRYTTGYYYARSITIGTELTLSL
jgi:iron complex outermembrane recepter protein